MKTRIISIMGVKDGVGASAFALELARTLQKEGGSVLLFDADPLYTGDLRFLLESKSPCRALEDLKQMPQPWKESWIKAYLSGREKVACISLAKGRSQLRAQDPNIFLEPFFSLLPFFDWVVVDLGSQWSSFSKVLLAQTDFLLFILKPEPSLFEELKRKLEELSFTLFPLQRVGWAGPKSSFNFAIPFLGTKPEECLEILKSFPPKEKEKKDFPSTLIPAVAGSRAAVLKIVQKKMEEKKIKPGQDLLPVIRETLQEYPELVANIADLEAFIQTLLDDLTGFGPLEPLLKNREHTEILINGYRSVFVEEKGCLKKTEISFAEEGSLQRVIERILLPMGRRVDTASPMVDVRLGDGSRVNIILPPLAVDGPTISIRRFSPGVLQPEDYLRLGTANEGTLHFLKETVLKKKNILVSGGTGSGKTTLLNVLSSFIPAEERIITIEDAAELRLNQPHVVRLEARPPNIEGKGAVTIRDLVRNALRMRPDRIVVGECRGGEALDMLQAMNTGHEGSLTTLHANTPRDALARLETLVLFSGVELPSKVIREQIASAIHCIVQIGRFPNGSRKITSITQINGLEGENFLLHDHKEFFAN